MDENQDGLFIDEKIISSEEYKSWSWFKHGDIKSVLENRYTKRIKEASAKLSEKIKKYQQWKQKSDKPGEDDIRMQKQIIKKLREEIKGANQEYSKNPSDEKADEIDKLTKILETNSQKLKVNQEATKNCIHGIEIAKLFSEYDKTRQILYAKSKTTGYWAAWYISIFILPFATLFLANILGKFLFDFELGFVTIVSGTLIVGSIASVMTILTSFRRVNHQREVVIEFLGQFFTIWEAGPHFLMPFFMKARGPVYLGDWGITLYLGASDDEEKMSARVDFADSSAEIIVELFFRIFDSYRSQYEIDDVIGSVREKMEAGIRAYYGEQTVDEAIRGRADVDLRDIIIQDATGADKFKSWGVEIKSLAVTDIKLDKTINEQRVRKLTVEKDLEIAEKEIEIAEAKKKRKVIDSSAEGSGLKKSADDLGISAQDFLEFELKKKKFEAYSKAGVLIVGGSEELNKTAAIAGAVANQTGSAINKKEPENSSEEMDDEKNKTSKK